MATGESVAVACVRIQDGPRARTEIRRFGTTTTELLELHRWLTDAECTHVAIQSTSVYWKPVFNLLEGSFEVVLAEADEVRERRDQARHPSYAKPELVATGPNHVWSWDITKLKGPVQYLYYSLYVILDLFSRYVVGWMVALHESARLAQRLIEATCLKQGIGPHQLTIWTAAFRSRQP